MRHRKTELGHILQPRPLVVLAVVVVVVDFVDFVVDCVAPVVVAAVVVAALFVADDDADNDFLLLVFLLFVCLALLLVAETLYRFRSSLCSNLNLIWYRNKQVGQCLGLFPCPTSDLVDIPSASV